MDPLVAKSSANCGFSIPMFDHQKVKPHVVNQLFMEYSQLGYVQHKLNGLLVAMLGYASKSALLSREGRVILAQQVGVG